MKKQKWMIELEDERGNNFNLINCDYIGTAQEAIEYAALLAGEWQNKHNGRVVKVEIRSHGYA